MGNACAILAEIGTLSLEFEYLSDLTENSVYKQKVFSFRYLYKN